MCYNEFQILFLCLLSYLVVDQTMIVQITLHATIGNVLIHVLSHMFVLQMQTVE